ncbi:Protein of uncharacterised function (DUF2762) [uncultured Clostridium sp.]|nr:Protein of uncharacterised function (DUF2762) [uncultured Clostridium sp.]SCI90097.1 Protein of uncharacterised function (DUF2762) [uncultured Clostridium sp.]
MIKIVFSQYGVFAGLFLLLFIFVLKENNNREIRYQNIIDKNQKVILEQAKSFEIVKTIKEDVDDLKTIIISKS